MIQSPVIRPDPSDKKIRTSDDFELCYLRHQYFRRVKYNPTEEEMEPFMYIVANLTKNTFFTYFNLFKAVGMYYEDVMNIGRVHLVSFLGLYHLDKAEAKKKEFRDKFEKQEYKEPEAKDYLQKNRANFTMFFKQRMEDLVRVCRQKVRNIKGQPSEEYVVFCGAMEPPKYNKKLLKEHEAFGYKKIDFAIFKSIRKKIEVDADATVFKFNEMWYVAIALEQRSLELDDIIGSGNNPYENNHNIQPDKLYENLPIAGADWNTYLGSHKVVKEEKDSEYVRARFDQISDYRKKVKLRKFVAKNQYKRQYREEVLAAKKLLKGLRG